jgi:hypothetical protein
MQVRIIAAACLAVLGLAGCGKSAPQSPPTPPAHGRYAGVGIYSPGEAWSKLAAEQESATPAAAHTRDDEAVIVVVDGQTGEIRECGDLSGYCVGMNPWKTALSGAQAAPVPLHAHDAESESGSASAASSASSSR